MISEDEKDMEEQEEPEGEPEEMEMDINYTEHTELESQSRWRSKYLWISVAAVIAFILGNWGLYEKVGLNNESFQNLVNLVLSALAAAGIINNPTDKKNW